MSCGGGRGARAALCLIGWLWGQRGGFGCFITQFGENTPVKLVRKKIQRQKHRLNMLFHLSCFFLLFFLLVFDAFMWKTKEGWLHRRLLHSWMFWTFNSPSEKFCCSQRRRLLKSLMFDSSKFSEFYSPESRSINNKPDLCLKQACIDCMKCICYYISISLSFLSFTFLFFETAVKLLSANVSH